MNHNLLKFIFKYLSNGNANVRLNAMNWRFLPNLETLNRIHLREEVKRLKQIILFQLIITSLGYSDGY